MINPLFPIDVPLDSRRIQPSESAYQWLSRHDSPNARRSRQLFESWFAHYPETDRENVRTRFCGRDDALQADACTQIYLFALFAAQDFEVEVEVPTENGNPVDFRLSVDGNPLCIVEAVRDDGLAARRSTDAALDELLTLARPKVTVPGFAVHVHSCEFGGPTASPARFARFLDEWFTDATSRWRNESRLETGELRIYEDRGGGAKLELELMVLPDRQNIPESLAGIIDGGVEWVRPRLAEALKRKRSQHKGATLPLYIAYVCNSFMTAPGDHEVFDALLGTSGWRFPRRGPGEGRFVRKPDGVFAKRVGHDHTRPAGLIVVSCCSLVSVLSADAELIENPHAAAEEVRARWRLRRRWWDMKSGELCEVPGERAVSLLGVQTGRP